MGGIKEIEDKIEKLEEDSVLIQDGQVRAWVDVWVENEEVESDWNKYFFLTDIPEDIAQSKWQSNPDNFTEATSLAIQTLVDKNIIYEKEAKWYKN